MFVEVDQETGLPKNEATPACIYSIAEMKTEGFVFIETKHGMRCTEVHYTGPFQLKFDDGRTITAECIDSDYLGVKSTHRVILCGGIPGEFVSFQAVAGIPLMDLKKIFTPYRGTTPLSETTIKDIPIDEQNKWQQTTGIQSCSGDLSLADECKMYAAWRKVQIELVKGLCIRTLKGEVDTDEDGQDRITPPGSRGVLMYENVPNQWAVYFGEASVHIEESELRDPAQYSLLPM